MGRTIVSDARRDAWRDFICSPDHAGRHLASLGASVSPALSDQIDLPELEAFLQRLRGGERDVTLLASLVELSGGNYLEFFAESLPDLLDQLSTDTERRNEIVGPKLVGAPRWGATRIGRASGQLRFGQFYSRTAHRSYDIPENRVVAWLVGNVAELIGQVLSVARGRGLPVRVEALRQVSDELSQHPVLRDSELRDSLDPDDLDAAAASHRPEYRQAAALATSLQTIVQHDEEARWFSILMLLAVGWMEPVSDDDLFEMYALVSVIDVLAKDLGLGDPVEFGLVVSGRKHVALFDSADGPVSVFFDVSVPASLGRLGNYAATVAEYEGVTGSERRPDIIVTRRSGIATQVVLIEVKRSDSERYISDSIYKMYGYLYDQKHLWHPQSPNPHAILLVPGTVKRVSNEEYRELAICSGDDRASLAAMLSSAFA